MSMIASGAPGYTTRPAPSCARLAGLCIGHGDHEMHWGPANEITSPQTPSGEAVVSAQLFSCEYQPGQEDEPKLTIGFGPFDGDLKLHEADQMLAALKVLTAKFEIQVAQLEAARRQWEATR